MDKEKLLLRNPFTTTANPSLLYLTPSLRDVIDRVSFVVEARQGFTVIYGDVGLGKSTLLRFLFNEYTTREDCSAALIAAEGYGSELVFLRAICEELNLPMRRAMLAQKAELKEFLFENYREGRNVVLFVDEAQRIPGKSLELIRTLLNFESDDHKLIQFVVAGQFELRERLRDPSKRALRSRILLSSNLNPLTLDDTEMMLAFRCQQKGVTFPFSTTGVKRLYELGGGVPRHILRVAETAWGVAVGAYSETVSDDLIERLGETMEPADEQHQVASA
jgi:type II secretory pathway predicted ATPase ExeA